MIYAGTKRNWRIVGLSEDNFVIVQSEFFGRYISAERPSEYLDVAYLMPQEKRILRKGMTRSGRDRDSRA